MMDRSGRRPLVVRIDTAALTHNLGVARRHAAGARVLAVVKANGYGHGLLRVARAMRDADGYAVLGLEEAVILREAGRGQPIVLLEGFFHPDELEEIRRLRLTPVIHRDDQIEALVRLPDVPKVDVCLKMDTGMRRLGFPPDRFRGALDRLRALSQVGRITLMTHFARADESDVGVAEPLALFQRVTDGLDFPRSLANSPALLRYPDTRGDWVRPGIMLYGASPFPDASAASLDLRPAMHLRSELIAVRQLRQGDSLGYGGLFTAPRDMRIGVVACGYADGYPRHAPTGTPIRVSGKLTRTLGRVSMDMLFVDLEDIPEAGVGAPVVLWGDGLPAEHVAAAAGTIAYELFTALAPRVRIEET